MRRNPRGDWTIRDVETLCRAFAVDCEPSRAGSSHYKVSHPRIAEILTVPFKRPIKPVYIRRLVVFIDEVGNSVDRLEYQVVITPLSEEDGGGFAATVPDLPGCMSDGDTPEQAIANVQDAIAAWIEAAHDLGRPIPDPSRAVAIA